MKIFGKKLKDYILPIKHYILIAILIVISQYYIALPLSDRHPYLLNITQALWAITIALSVVKLTVNYNFNMKNVFFVGVLYSIIIHGLKAFFFRIFLFPYSGSPKEVLFKIFEKFFYGSFLVMVVVIIIGLVFIRIKNNSEIKEFFKNL